MPNFSSTSAKRLSTCDQRLQDLFNEVIKYYDCTILEGYRTKEEQNEYYRTGKSTLQYPESKHNKQPSKAVDVIPYHKEAPHYRWEDKQGFSLFAGFVLGIASQMNIPIRWGGDWDGDKNIHEHSFIDMPHFEIDE